MPKDWRTYNRYVKVADRRAARMATVGKRVRCANCGDLTFSPYWWNWRGKEREQPLCPECHEREVSQMTRDGEGPTNRIADEDG